MRDCNKFDACGCDLTRFQLDEDTTEAGAEPVKSGGFKVPPPPGYKPKPQTTMSESTDVPTKKVRGIDE